MNMCFILGSTVVFVLMYFAYNIYHGLKDKEAKARYNASRTPEEGKRRIEFGHVMQWCHNYELCITKLNGKSETIWSPHGTLLVFADVPEEEPEYLELDARTRCNDYAFHIHPTGSLVVNIHP